MKDTNKDLEAELRTAIGERVGRARERLPDKRRQLQEFAARIKIPESTLSMMEAGKRSIPAERLALIAREAGVNPGDFFVDAPNDRRAQAAFSGAIEFLRQAQSLGLEGVTHNRNVALFAMIPYIQSMWAGEIAITGSSFKGLQQDTQHPFIDALKKLCERQGKLISVKAIMTHPQYGYDRELLERRVTGSIVVEIFQGIRWAVEQLGIPEKNIRLAKTSPTCFSIFAKSDRDGMGIFTPYLLMKQAFTTATMIVRYGERGGTSAQDESIFTSYYLANFQDPWNDQTGNITVDLDRGLTECLRELAKNTETAEAKEKRAILVREATTLKDYLARHRSRAPEGQNEPARDTGERR